MADTNALAVVAAEIARLRNGYLQSLPAQVDELKALADTLCGNESDRAALEDLHHRLHKLAGSGGTFGLNRLSETARGLERTAKSWLAAGVGTVDAAARNAFIAGIATLPSTLGEGQDAQVAGGSPERSPAPAATPGKAINVWLVDDDAALGRELAQIMGQFGYETRLFTRIEDVEVAAAGENPDILILDVMFPEEGVNATEAMLARPALRNLACPLLFISAHGDFESRVRAARAGAIGFLLKPIDVPRLVDRIEKIFEDREAAPYRVLIVDDDTTLAEHYRLVLAAAGMEVEVLADPRELIDHVSVFRPEIVLMDMHMPDYEGPELAEVIRQHEEWISIPIVYLSAETDLDKQIEALGHGADDFLTKPITDARLVSAVRVRVGRSRQLADLMAKDSLTGLLKHARIKEEIDLELVRARRSGKPMCVIMTDIDHFKRVNDTYGHAVGDRVIKAVAHMLKQRLRRTDSIGRYGGEEFAVALPDCDTATALEIMNDIRERFAALRFNHAGTEFGCTLSAGISCSLGSADWKGGDLLVAADEALYKAKHGGRNQVCVAGDAG